MYKVIDITDTGQLPSIQLGVHVPALLTLALLRQSPPCINAIGRIVF